MKWILFLDRARNWTGGITAIALSASFTFGVVGTLMWSAEDQLRIYRLAGICGCVGFISALALLWLWRLSDEAEKSE